MDTRSEERATATSAAAEPAHVVQVSRRVDIVSDTHGRLSEALLAELEGADLIIHAGDITSESDWEHLRCLAPVKGVLGNNDYYYTYGDEVQAVACFVYEGLRFCVAHYREDLPLSEADVAVCGHTHRSRIEQVGSCLLVNPGSATYPRGGRGATMARMLIADGKVISATIIDLA